MTTSIEAAGSPVSGRQARTVDDVMTAPVATVRASDGLRAAINRFYVCALRHLIVVDDSGRFVGVINDRVATIAVEQDQHELDRTSVRDLALDRDTVVRTGTSVLEAAEEMLRHSAGALAVTDDRGRVIGIVTGADLLRAFVEDAATSRPRGRRQPRAGRVR